MTEQKALAKLRAKDWGSLNKKQGKKFFDEIAPNLSEDVRLKILETAPDILHTAQDVYAGYLANANKMLDQNHDMAKAYVFYCDKFGESLRALISGESASFEERAFWSNQLFILLDKLHEYDKSNKNHQLKIFAGVGTAFLVVVSAIVYVITGGKINLRHE